jgi:hypothetical protein
VGARHQPDSPRPPSNFGVCRKVAPPALQDRVPRVGACRTTRPASMTNHLNGEPLPLLPLDQPCQPPAHPHPLVGHDDRGFHRSLPQRPRHEGSEGGSPLRHRTRCRREGPGLDRSQMLRGGGHREGRAGCVVAPGCGTVAEPGSGMMVLDQPRLGIARW